MNQHKYILAFAAFILAAQPLNAQQYRYGRTDYGGGQFVPANSQFVPASGGGGNLGNSGYGNSGYGNGYGNSGYAGNYGQYPYANQSGYGYYPSRANTYGAGFPAFGAPVAVDGGYYRFNGGGFAGSYWRSPSGYYYPWGAGAVYSSPPPIIYINQGSSQPALPPVADMLRDMSTYIDEQNTKKKFKPEDYQHLARRVKDLQSLESSMRSRNNGTLEQNDEESLRKDCAMLSGDISRRIIP